MGKTLGSILVIAAAVAVNVIPGVGQVVSGALTATLGATAAGTITAGLTLSALSSLGGLIGLGPKSPRPEATTMAMTARSSDLITAAGLSAPKDALGWQHSQVVIARPLPTQETMPAKLRDGPDPFFSAKKRLAISRMTGTCMGWANQRRYGVVDRDAEIRRGDLFMFGVDDFDHWTDVLDNQPDPVGGVAKRFIGVDHRRGVMMFECNNPPLRMEVGLHRVTFAHRYRAVARTRWGARLALLQIALGHKDFQRQLG